MKVCSRVYTLFTHFLWVNSTCVAHYMRPFGVGVVKSTVVETGGELRRPVEVCVIMGRVVNLGERHNCVFVI